MDTKTIFDNLEKLNLNVSVASVFLNYVATFDNGYEGFFRELDNNRKNMIESFDYEKYEEVVLDYLKKVQSVVAKDPLVKKNNKELVAEYKRIVKQIINKNLVFYSLKQADKIISEYQDEVIKLDLEIENINQDKNLSGVDKTFKISETFSKLSQLNLKYKNAMLAKSREEEIISKFKTKDIQVLFSELTSDFDKLIEVVNKLNLEANTKVEVNNLSGEFTNYFTNSPSMLDLFDASLVDKYDEFIRRAGLTDDFYSLTKNMSYEELISFDDVYFPDVEEEKVEVKETSAEEKKEEVVKVLEEPKETVVKVSEEPKEEVEEEINLSDIQLDKGAELVYNGSTPLFGENNSEKLEQGVIYNVDRVETDENGLDKVYLENMDGSFEPTMFETLKKNTANRVVNFEKVEENKDDKRVDAHVAGLSGLLKKENIAKSIKNAIVNCGNSIVNSSLYKKASNGLKHLSKAIKNYIKPYADYYEDEEEIMEEGMQEVEKENTDKTIDSTFDEKAFAEDFERIRQQIREDEALSDPEKFDKELEEVKKLVDYKNKDQIFEEQLEEIKELVGYNQTNTTGRTR